jgi:hypothetical protein
MARCLPLFALVMAAILAQTLAWGQEPPPYHGEQPAAAEQSDGAIPRPVANAVANKDRSEGKQEGKWYSTFLDHTPDWFVAIFTALLTYVTYRLVKTTGNLRQSTDKLWEAGERQIQATRDIAATQTRLTRQQLAIAKESADAAKASVDAVVVQLRANIGIKNADITNMDGPGPWYVTLVFENFGETPAYDLTMWGAFHVRPAGVVARFKNRDEDRSVGSNSMLAQHAEIEQGHKIQLTYEQQIALTQGKATLYVYGDIRYRDAFKNDRFFRYRYMCGGEAGMRTLQDAKGKWTGLLTPCPDGNEAN